MRFTRPAIVAVILSVLTGCATLITKPIVDNSDIKENKGISYSLPKRLHKVQLAATPAIKALEETKSKLENAATLKAEADKKLVETKAALEKAKTEYEAAKKLNDTTPEGQKKLAELKNAWATKKAEEKLMGELAKEAGLTYYGLLDELVKLSALKAKMAISIKIEPQDPVADEENQLIAKPIHWINRDDSWDLTTDAQGLLASTDNTSVDRTGDIVLKIAQAIAAGWGGPLKVYMGAPLPELLKGEEDCGIGPNEAYMKAEYLVDFSKRKDIWPVDNWLCHWGYKIDVSGYRKDKKKMYFRQPKECLKKNGECLKKYLEDSELSNLLNLNSSGVGGLVYRRELPYKVQVCKAETEGGCDMPIAVFTIQMPNMSPYSVVEFNAGLFTTTKNSVKFDKGFLVSSHHERPSELLGLVSLPAEFTKSYLKMVTEIISLKIDYSSKEADYMDTLGKQIDAEKALKEKQVGN